MRILVVSDIRVVQEGLHSVLAQLNPDIVLFDAARLESIGIVKELVASSPHSKVVAFGVKETDAGVSPLAGAGTPGCVGDSAASGEMVRRLLEGAGGNGQACTMPLSPRELQIAHLLEGGLTNKAIGRQLGIEAATVKNHLHNICEKLKVHRRGEIAARIRAILGVSTTLLVHQ
jgi:two-component system nitrate/nitrite response regulator NarL